MEIITNIVELIENEPRISHRVIAEQTENKEESVSRLIRDNLTDFEDFGMVGFEIRAITNAKNRANEIKTYFLNEQQATLLMSYLRNNPIVKNFKKLLVKEFFRMRELLQNQKSQTQTSQNLQKPDFPALTNELNDYEIYSNKLLGFIENLRNRNQIDLFRFDKIMLEQFGTSPLQTFRIDLESQFFLPTELGKMINKSPVEINLMIENRGFQVRENGVWKVTSSGEEFGIEIVGNYHQLKWKMKTVL